MPSREVGERLQDILEAVERINRHTAAMSGTSYDRDAGLADVYRDAVHYQLIVIGEAIRTLPEATKARDPEIPWSAGSATGCLTSTSGSIRRSFARSFAGTWPISRGACGG